MSKIVFGVATERRDKFFKWVVELEVENIRSDGNCRVKISLNVKQFLEKVFFQNFAVSSFMKSGYSVNFGIFTVGILAD